MSEVIAELEYQGRHYTVTREWDSRQYDADLPRYMWTDGNYGCDCNRSQFIQEQCDEDFPDLPCGETITLVSLTITPPDVTDS